MSKKYKVGIVTDFGLLLAESVKLANYRQTVSLYENEDKSEYTIIEWEMTDEWFEIDISRDTYDTSDKAWRMWTTRVFGVSF